MIPSTPTTGKGVVLMIPSTPTTGKGVELFHADGGHVQGTIVAYNRNAAKISWLLARIVKRLFLQAGLGVTFGYMFSTAYLTNDRTGMVLMIAGAIGAFWVFAR